MSYGISTLSIIPCRAEASDTSEMVTQLLFGEVYEVIDQETHANWIKIKIALDDYKCWICEKQFSEITAEEYENQTLNNFPKCGELTSFTTKNEKRETVITLGATLPYYSKNSFKIRQEKFIFKGSVNQANKSKIIDYAMLYLHTPYLWGGRSPFGIDCSGFSQIVYSLCGYKIPRDAYQQAEEGFNVEFIELTEPGDLAFFDNEEGRVTHVGIITEPGKIIHASGKVRIDSIDQQGIFNHALGKYTHKLRIVKRLF